jgi:hypothetical protein
MRLGSDTHPLTIISHDPGLTAKKKRRNVTLSPPPACAIARAIAVPTPFVLRTKRRRARRAQRIMNTNQMQYFFLRAPVIGARGASALPPTQ